MKKILIFFLVLLVSFPFTARIKGESFVDDDWLNYLKDVSHSSYASSVILPPMSLTWQARVEMDQSGLFSLQPLISGNNIFFPDGRTMVCFDLDNGAVKWRFKTFFNIVSTGAIYNNVIYFVNSNGFLYALDTQNGSKIWELPLTNVQPLNFITYSALAVQDGIILVGAQTQFTKDSPGALIAVDTNGKRLWISILDYSILDSKPLIIKEKSLAIVITSRRDFQTGNEYNNNFVYAIDLKSGTKVWEKSFQKDILMSPILTDKGVVLPSSRFIAAGNWKGYISLIEPQTGSLIWEQALSEDISGSIVSYKDYILVSGQKSLFALNIENGKIVTETQLVQANTYIFIALSGRIFETVVEQKDASTILIFTTTNGILGILNLKDLAILRTINIEGRLRNPSISRGRVAVSSLNPSDPANSKLIIYDASPYLLYEISGIDLKEPITKDSVSFKLNIANVSGGVAKGIILSNVSWISFNETEISLKNIYYEKTLKTFTVTIDTSTLKDGDHEANIVLDYTGKRIEIPIKIIVKKGAVEPPIKEKIELKFQVGNKMMYVNGVAKEMDVAPIILNNRTLIPIRYVAEPLGAQVSWDSTERKVSIVLGTTTLHLWIGKPTALLNGQSVPIDAKDPKVVPVIIQGRTLLPLRFVSESLGCSVLWDNATKGITIIYPATP